MADKITDLKKYLNFTASEHNGVDYSRFCELIQVTVHPSGKINRAALARACGVDERTIARWLKQISYKEVLENG